MRADPTLLRPTNEAARRAVLCGDPAAALALAQALLEKPLMFNHAHGLWGYVGAGPDGERLHVQSTGVGGPSAALVLGDLAAVGVQAAVRVGRGWGRHAPGTLVAATEVTGRDGASAALGGVGAPDADLTAALADRADARGALVSYDLPVLGEPLADLEGAALVAAAGRHRVRLAVGVVVVGDLDDEGLAAAKERAGRAALEALLA
jgi:uridine phosphorylase